MSLVELVLGVHRHLDADTLPHAFGGALALAYVAEPRSTVDVDVNVFVALDQQDRVLAALDPLNLRREENPLAVPIAGIRLLGPTPYLVDLFLSLDERYAEAQRRCVAHPFGRGGDILPFLSPEDLAVFKLSFGRDKDWVDLRAIARAQPRLDIDYVESQLVGLRGPSMHPRIARLRRLLRPA